MTRQSEAPSNFSFTFPLVIAHRRHLAGGKRLYEFPNTPQTPKIKDKPDRLSTKKTLLLLLLRTVHGLCRREILLREIGVTWRTKRQRRNVVQSYYSKWSNLCIAPRLAERRRPEKYQGIMFEMSLYPPKWQRMVTSIFLYKKAHCAPETISEMVKKRTGCVCFES